MRVFLVLTICAGFFYIQIAQSPSPPVGGLWTLYERAYANIFGINIALAANSQDVVINEIAWMGTTNSANDEWIELYNNTDAVVDLIGWALKAVDGTPAINLQGTISAKSYFLLERTSDETLPAVTADLIYTGALGNSGEKLELRDASNNLIDTVDCSGGWFAGDNTTKATMERIDSTKIGDATNWATNNQGSSTPKAQNSVYQSQPVPSPSPTPSPSQEQSNNNQQNSNALPSVFSPGDIVINEIMSAPKSGEREWVELYKNLNSEIDLTDWTIEEGSGSVTQLSGKLGKTYKFFIAENLKGKLNNEGDVIILKWNGKVIDKVSYGDWNDGELRDNASAAESPNSLARIIDGKDTDNDLADFIITSIVTKSSVNQISQEEENKEAQQKEEANVVYSDQIILNEILPNPVGDDSEKEFIELKNLSTSSIDLTGWKIGDAGQRLYTISANDFKDTIITTKAYFTIYRQVSKIAFNNNGDEVKLYQPNGQLADSIKYDQKVVDDASYARDENNTWQWTTVATPGKENKINALAFSPQAVISAPVQAEVNQEVIFDGSDSSDKQGEKLSYFWEFGDGETYSDKIAKHSFGKSGKYEIKLTVSSNDLKNSCTWEVTVNDKDNLAVKTNSVAAMIILNEILPNPTGSDNEEFIEIYNIGKENVNLKDWSLDDEEGGSKPYKIKDDLIIKVDEYLVIKKKESSISLNNNGDAVRLFDAENNLVDEIVYEPVPEGASFSLAQDGNWYWTATITPGKANKIDQSFLTGVNNEQNFSVFEVPLAEINELEIGDEVSTQGIVSVVPGVLGTQIFYLAGSGIQIYMFKKDFPDLKEGDLVKVVGVLSESGGERRIKIKNKEDIVVLEHKDPPAPQELLISEADEEKIGNLIKIKGDLTQKNSSGFYLDDGEEEIYVYLKSGTGIDKKSLAEGDQLEVTGIVSMTKSGIRLLPRYQEDIIKTGQVLGAFANADAASEITEKSKSDNNLIKYLIASIAALLLIIIGLGYKIFQIKKAELS